MKAWPKTRSGILVFWEKGWKAMPQGEDVDHPDKTGLGRGESEMLDNYASSGEKISLPTI